MANCECGYDLFTDSGILRKSNASRQEQAMIAGLLVGIGVGLVGIVVTGLWPASDERAGNRVRPMARDPGDTSTARPAGVGAGAGTFED